MLEQLLESSAASSTPQSVDGGGLARRQDPAVSWYPYPLGWQTLTLRWTKQLTIFLAWLTELMTEEALPDGCADLAVDHVAASSSAVGADGLDGVVAELGLGHLGNLTCSKTRRCPGIRIRWAGRRSP
ncbi:unnamed protein product [Sphagnum tenellum]